MATKAISLVIGEVRFSYLHVFEPWAAEEGANKNYTATLLIPKDNVSDLYEVDDEVKKNIQFLPMSNLAQVLNAALLKPKTVSARHSHPGKKAKKPADAAAIPQTTEQPKPGAVC